MCSLLLPHTHIDVELLCYFLYTILTFTVRNKRLQQCNLFHLFQYGFAFLFYTQSLKFNPVIAVSFTAGRHVYTPVIVVYTLVPKISANSLLVFCFVFVPSANYYCCN